MRIRNLSALVVSTALIAVPAKSFGLAALASGAKTSCKPTAPAGSPLYRTQVNCDPADVQSFQFHFEYDSSLVTYTPDDFTALNGYTVSVEDDTPESSLATPIRSLIVTGSAPDSSFDTSGDLSHIDVIGINFELVDHSNTGTPVHFAVLGEPDHPGERADFIHTFDDGDVFLTAADDTFADETFDEIHAVPLPASAWGGMALLTGLGAYRLMRKPAVSAE